MRQDQLQRLYAVTLVVLAAGFILEGVSGKSLSDAVLGAITGLFASLLAATLIATYAEWTTLGIVRFYQAWRDEEPELDLQKAFRYAKEIDICAVAFWNSLFGKEWFERVFKERVGDVDKKTRILLLQPGGIEINRRQKEGRPPEEGEDTLVDRNNKSVLKIQGVLEKERVEPTEYLRFFDHSPGMNWMRVDEQGYLIMLGHGPKGDHRGGFSPGLLLQRSRIGGGTTLFDVHQRNFNGMWRAAAPTARKHPAADQQPGADEQEGDDGDGRLQQG